MYKITFGVSRPLNTGRLLTPFSTLFAGVCLRLHASSSACKSLVVAVTVICCGLGIGVAEARSTFSARFDPETVAGPGTTHDLLLALSYFPGDGEGIVRARIGFDPGSVRLVSAHSALGVLIQSVSGFEIDYSGRPLSEAVSDSLSIVLVPTAESTDVPFEGRLYSSADAEAVAHRVSVALRVRPPADLAMSARPNHVYPGEQVAMEFRFHNLHSDLPVSGLRLDWPDGISPDGRGDDLSERAIGPGDSTAAVITCRIGGAGPRVDLLGGRVTSGEVHGSPVGPVEVYVAGLPALRSTTAERLQVGIEQRLSLEWHNPVANDTLKAQAFRVSVPASFADVSVVGDVASSAAFLRERADGSREVVVEDPLPLEPGGRLSFELQAIPQRPGPFAWTGSFVPEGRAAAVSAGGDGVLVWVDPAEGGLAISDSGDDDVVPTDLEAVTMAMHDLLIHEIAGAPLASGDRVRLSPTHKGTRSWVVDELLTEALMENGVTVALSSPAEEGDGMATLYYRLVDARVVYAARGGALKSVFGPETRSRAASGDLLLRLERADGSVDWARRVQASRTDVVSERQMAWLGSEDVVHEEVKPGNKILELGLSGSIAVGLLLIFFAP